MKIYKQWFNLEKKKSLAPQRHWPNSSRVTKRSSCAFSHFSQSPVPHFCVQHVEKETNVGQLQGEGSQKKVESTKGQLLLPEGAMELPYRGCLARWKANARSTREWGHWRWFLSIKSHHSRTLKKHASCILTRIWCKMGLTGLHDSPARVLNILFIVWLSRVCLWATALFCKIRGAIFCSLRSVMVLFLLNASFSWEFALG